MLKIKLKNPVIIALGCWLLVWFSSPAPAEYEKTGHRKLEGGAVAVTGPGSYDKPGTTYMLTADVECSTSPIFLGKDVILDLNGYTITYAAGDYRNNPNCGFEQGLQGWDTSRAPGARVVETEKVHVFIGKKILSLPAGEQIVSGYVTLPVADRSYYAICGVARRDMQVSVYVEDENGAQVRCKYGQGNDVRISCPVERKSPRLGGGFVFAHLHGLPAGRYRVRVRAETDCLVDEIDIRPAGDVGIGIVGRVIPAAHNDDQYKGLQCAFFDYDAGGPAGEPVHPIPRVRGPGTVTIRNGVIKSGAIGVLSWGIQSTAEQVKMVLENVKIAASGINTNAVEVPRAVIHNCRFEIDTPFIINRHVSIHAVWLRGPGASEVSFCEFFGGQGCLTFSGENSKVHHNLFVNRQMVTNHYCVMARGDGSKIYNNRFEPEIGSGVEIYRHKNIAIFNNTFTIEASPPTCEYGHTDYSVNAVRLADYGAEPGSPAVCEGNRIYGNRFQIIGRDYPQYPDYIPMAYAFFQSVSGGMTFVYDNEIVVRHEDPHSKALAAAFYIGGSDNGGRWYGNRIVTNVPAVWVASRYGSASNVEIYDNTIIKAGDAPEDFTPVRMGWGDHLASDIDFRSNEIIGARFEVEATDRAHSYSVYWTLRVTATDGEGNALPGTEIKISDRLGREVLTGSTDSSGRFRAELLEYEARGAEKTVLSPYTVTLGGKSRQVTLDKNLAITLQSR